MASLDDVLSERRVAVVGIAKNCGKTTTLNFYLDRARASGKVAAVLSIGVDGEAFDALLGTPKPPIAVEEGQLVVTAERAMLTSSAELEPIESMGFDTTLGEVHIARVVGDGEVLLAGLRHRGDVQRAVEHVEALGADITFIDGAYGRVMSASPEVSDAVVVSTGAIVGTAPTVVEKTNAVVRRLMLPEIDVPWGQELMRESIARERVLMGGSAIEPIELPARSALLALPKARRLWRTAVEALAVPGLVSDRVLEELARRGGTDRRLLIRDGTVVQADERAVAKLMKKNWAIQVLQPARVVAITVNPTSVRGPGLNRERLCQTLAAAWPKIPVFDPVSVVQ